MTQIAPSSWRTSWPLVLARVGLGVSFLFSDHGNASAGELAGFLNYAVGHGFRWYAAFIERVVQPNEQLFSMLVLVGELYVGVALVLGVTTRLAAGVALFLCINYLAAKGMMPWTPGIDQSDILLSILLIAAPAGRVFGIDRYLRERFPRVPLW